MIVGRAIYEKAFTVEEAIARAAADGLIVLAKRIIPCLDVDGGRVKKGVRFKELRDAGDPVAVAAAYDRQGADEICFLDISASAEGRATTIDMVRATAEQVFLPLTVGGGVRSVEDVRALLLAGADKVGINTAAVADPELVRRAADAFGSPGHRGGGGRAPPRDRARRAGLGGLHPRRAQPTGLDAVAWCVRMAELGAGEILLTSMDRDGTRDGFDLELTRAVADRVPIPVIASGGVGDLQHLYEGIAAGRRRRRAGGVDLPLRRAHRGRGPGLPARPGRAGAAHAARAEQP